MGLISTIIDIVLHVDKYLTLIIQYFGGWTYALVFLVIFLETGLVLTPFLPGDSLIFALGTFAAVGTFNIWLLFLILALAAILGDTVNYWIGSYIGSKVFTTKSKLLNKEHLHKTQRFFDRYGGKTIIIARFIPIIRTFAPFLAGVGKMRYWKFLVYNVIGGIAWVGLFLWGGYFFGNIPWVQKNLTLVVILIIATSLIPVIISIIQKYQKRSNI